ncbi:hypothetical protein P3T76_007402 [Phytophthora citrophthora]|uniref:Uncharacterized protein n=1 Tax=Phytophthora citrophthora TaxID=4793 RepID=A0AAD9GP91_9STRA|nr:hypothetical protein P3T76_007402 [Phytophthora citrophthora]
MDAKPTPTKPSALSTASEENQSTQQTQTSPKSPACSPDSLLKSPSAFEQKPLRMPKPMSI